jgi:hypothetical protein
MVIPITFSSDHPIAPQKTTLPSVVKQISLFNQTGGISTTALFTPKEAGVYRVSVYQMDTLNATSGTLSTVIDWTDSRTSLSQKPASDINLATIHSFNNGQSYIHSDANQTISYQSTISGISGTPKYSLLITVEKLS